MISRVSDLHTFSELSVTLNRLRSRIDELTEQVSTGYRVNRPSDDPSAAATVVRSLSAIAGLDRDTRAADFARGFLGAQDALLDDARNVLDRAKEIAVQQANGVLTDGERQAAAEEVHALLEGIVGIGNAEQGGRRLFGAGAEVASSPPPFTDPNDPAFDPLAPYTGPAAPFEVAIAADQRLRVTTPGDQVLGSTIAALADLEARLQTNTDPENAIPLLDAAAVDLAAERASIGTRVGRVEDRAGQIEKADLITTEGIATARGADIVDLVTQLTQLQGQLQVATAAAERAISTSLVNLLSV
jgi:flagellar hook-associated protein 3 FlgL